MRWMTNTDSRVTLDFLETLGLLLGDQLVTKSSYKPMGGHVARPPSAYEPRRHRFGAASTKNGAPYGTTPTTTMHFFGRLSHS